MRKEWLILAAFLCGVILANTQDRPATAQRQELLKVGFVDLVQVRDKFIAYQTALNQIKATKDKEQTELDEMVATFDKSVKNYELRTGLVPEEELRNELEQLKQKYESLAEYHESKSRQLEDQSRETLKPLLDRMKAAIDQVSAAQSYHLIFWKKDLAYSDERLDITNDVLAVLNQ